MVDILEMSAFLKSIGVEPFSLRAHYMPNARYTEEPLHLRQDQTDQIVNVLSNTNAVRLKGLYGMGKTSMFEIVGNMIGAKKLWYTAGISKSPKTDHAWYELKEFLERIGSEEQPTLQDIQNYQDGIFGFLNDLAKATSKKIMVGIDELQIFDHRVIKYFANLPRKLPNLKFMFLDHHTGKLEWRKNRIFKYMPSFHLRALTLDEVRILAQTLLRQHGYTITNEAIATLHELTGGRPCEVTTVLSRFFEDHFWNQVAYRNQTIDYKKELGNKIIEQSTIELLYDPILILMADNETLSFSFKFNASFKMLHEQEKKLLLKIADFGQPTKKELIHARSLERLSLIIYKDNEWDINGILLSHFIYGVMNDKSWQFYLREYGPPYLQKDFDYKRERFN